MEDYKKITSKEEKLNMLQTLSTGPLLLISCIPKKHRNLAMMEEGVQLVLKEKRKKIPMYEDNIGKYEKMINVAETKFAEYDKKLSCY